jgi:lysozyme
VAPGAGRSASTEQPVWRPLNLSDQETSMTATGTFVRAASAALTPFLARHEGFVGSTYRDAGGVLTIGYGFTMLSRVFAAHWQKTRGRALKSGDKIGPDEADRLLANLLAAEYAPPVAARFKTLTQHAFDAATSVVYNAGTGTLTDRWASALADGAIASAANLLRGTRVTTGGKRIAGLVRRRADEARLLEHGDYGTPPTARTARPVAEVKAWQAQLATLGLYKGAIDGIDGPVSDAAVRQFQSKNGLTVDGVVGPATRAALLRAVEAKAAIKATTATGAGGAVTGAAQTMSEPPAMADPTPAADTLLWIFGLGLAAAIITALLFLIWRYRGVILKRRTPA